MDENPYTSPVPIAARRQLTLTRPFRLRVFVLIGSIVGLIAGLIDLGIILATKGVPAYVGTLFWISVAGSLTIGSLVGCGVFAIVSLNPKTTKN